MAGARYQDHFVPRFWLLQTQGVVLTCIEPGIAGA